MIIQPKIRGFICTTAHPIGCAANVQEQIDFIKAQGPIKGAPKNVLIIGSSTGYGLASRVACAFGAGASTIGAFFEREADGKRTATAGWYNTVAFEEKAKAQGLYAKSFNGDAFSDEMKEQVCDAIKNDLGKVDLVIYSLASPRRVHPKTGEVYKSVLKPMQGTYTNKSIDMSKNKIEEVTLPEATQDEIDQTVAVMGGEDWQMWIEALQDNDLLSDGAKTVAYSYIGPKVTQPVYRNGTIGKAKDHLEATVDVLNEKLKSINGQALISVNKALVTQSSSAIPFIPLYFIILNKIMKEANTDEDCIAQISRMMHTRLFVDGDPIVDENGFIRMDDLELDEDVQKQVNEIWGQVSDENLYELTDIEGYHVEFLKLFGFGFDSVDYNADVESELALISSK